MHLGFAPVNGHTTALERGEHSGPVSGPVSGRGAERTGAELTGAEPTGAEPTGAEPTGAELRKGARTRLRILDAGARVLRINGYAATRLADIAEVAGLRKGSLAFHFSSKTELLEEVVRHGFENGLNEVRGRVEALGANAGPAERLRVAIGVHLRELEERVDYAPAMLRSMDQFPAEVRHRLRDVDHGYVGYWVELVTAAQRSGQPPADEDPVLLVRLALGALNATLDRPVLEPRDQIVRAVCRLLGLRTGEPSG